MSAREQTVEARLRRLEDCEEVRHLITDFRRFIDCRDFAAIAALFADDGQLLTNLGPPATGPAEIEALLEKTLERFDEAQRTFHHVANTAIDVDRDHATAESNWSYIAREADDQPGLTLVGHYSDRFVRRDGEWKFLRRAVYVDIPYAPFDRSAAPNEQGAQVG